MINDVAYTSDSRLALRMPHLDSLRGLAALTVVIHHVLLSLPIDKSRLASYAAANGLGIVILGRPAVILFFVLSGFVLTFCLQGKRVDVFGFAVRRVIRLMPTFWVAILGAFLLFLVVPHHPAQSMTAWFNDQWAGVIDFPDLRMHLMMIAGKHQFPLDHVAWSLVHELRLSVALPFLVLIASRFGLSAAVVIALAVTIAADIYVEAHAVDFARGVFGFHFDTAGFGYSLILSARFALDFAIGFALARRSGWFASAFARFRWSRPFAVVFALLMLSQRHEIVMACGAALLIAAVASSAGLATLLLYAPLRWLGRISYSFYLVHLPLMLACGLMFDGLLPAPVSLAIAIVVALPVAEALCRYVETPSIRWSRAAADWIMIRRSSKKSSSGIVQISRMFTSYSKPLVKSEAQGQISMEKAAINTESIAIKSLKGSS